MQVYQGCLSSLAFELMIIVVKETRRGIQSNAEYLREDKVV